MTTDSAPWLKLDFIQEHLQSAEADICDRVASAEEKKVEAEIDPLYMSGGSLQQNSSMLRNEPEIQLPFGTKTIIVNEIPKLIAEAFHPHPPGDVNNLDWLHSASENRVVRNITEKAQFVELHSAISQGKLRIVNHLTGVPGHLDTGGTLLKHIVKLDDFKMYVGQFDIGVLVAEPPTAESTQQLTPAERRKSLDISKYRGVKRLILESWDDIERGFVNGINAHKVLRFLRNNPDFDKATVLKTIQNALTTLRNEGLIP